MAHSHADLGEILEGFLEIVGEALGGGTHGVDVHAVGAGAHDAAQTAGAELELTVEALDELGLILGVEHTLHFGTGLGVIFVAKPLLGFGGHFFQ